MGILELFLHHHCRRAYLEGDSTGLSAPDDCGPRAGLSREIPVGTVGDGTVWGAGNIGQPRADDVLLSVYRAGDGHCVHH